VASIYSTSPRPNIAVNRDTSNHPLWAYNSANTDGPQEDEGGRMGRFARRFGSNEGTISSKQEEALKKVDAAVEPLQGIQAGSDAALKVAEKQQQKQAKKEEASTASSPPDNAMDMFDLSLEGEVVEEIKHVQEDTGKKGKAGAKGKKGK
jgi:ribosomal protein L31